jgi:hypothetical protein
MTAKEMAFLGEPELFPSTNRSRLNKSLANKTIKTLTELNFLIDKLPPFYKSKILSDGNYDKFLTRVLSLYSKDLSNLDKKGKDMTIDIAARLLMDSVTVLLTVMPEDFKIPLKDSASPFMDLLQAIINFGRKNSLKGIPEIEIPDLFKAEGRQY